MSDSIAKQPVLVVLDEKLHAPQPALAKAVVLARALGAPLAVYVNAYNGVMVRAVGGDSQRLEQARASILNAWEKQLKKQLNELGSPDSTTHLFWEHDDKAVLAALVMSIEPKLITVHTEHIAGVKRLLFSPRHWRLIRKAPCSVFCVGSEPWPASFQVTLAVDTDHADSDKADQTGLLNNVIVEQGLQLAGDLEARYKVVNVIEYPDESLVLLAGDAIPVSLSNTAALREFYRKQLEGFCASLSLPAEHAELLEGPPHTALADYLAEHPGILVMGTVHRGPLKRMLLGSTAEQLLQHSHADVLVVKPKDFVSPWQNAATLDTYQQAPQ